jgi:hypothetical protein
MCCPSLKLSRGSYVGLLGSTGSMGCSLQQRREENRTQTNKGYRQDAIVLSSYVAFCWLNYSIDTSVLVSSLYPSMHNIQYPAERHAKEQRYGSIGRVRVYPPPHAQNIADRMMRTAQTQLSSFHDAFVRKSFTRITYVMFRKYWCIVPEFFHGLTDGYLFYIFT